MVRFLYLVLKSFSVSPNLFDSAAVAVCDGGLIND